MDKLFGSAPSAKFSTQSTIDPYQGDILSRLDTLFSGGTGVPNSFLLDKSGGDQLASTSLAALEQNALNIGAGPTLQQGGAIKQSFDALSQSLGYQAPKIDATDAFRRGVVQPMTDDFLQRTLPTISGVQGRSAGGAYGTGRQNANAQAMTDLERVLSQTGAQFTLGAEQANQNADIAGQKNTLAALGLAPQTITSPSLPTASNIGLAGETFNTYQKILADMIAVATPQTVQTIGVGSGGSTGLLSGILGGVGNFAGSSGGSALIASLLGGSDRALKENVEQVGSVAGFPLYRFTYKALPQAGKRLGLMAQDVEKRLPSAVSEFAGYKRVDYGAVLENVLREAA